MSEYRASVHPDLRTAHRDAGAVAERGAVRRLRWIQRCGTPGCRAADGLPGGQRRRPDRLPARQPHVVLLWRNVLGRVARRCLAPDLVGMGASDKLPDSGPGSSRFVEQRRHLDALLDGRGVQGRTVLVGHDWGGVLAVDWARRHPAAVRGIAYLETLVARCRGRGPTPSTPALFGPLRGPAGERLVLAENAFVEKVLPAGTLRTLTGEEMDAYRAPYREPGESRRPTLTWPREISIDGEPADVTEIVTRNAEWMASTPVPKLFVNGDPGALLTGPLREQCRRWPTQDEVTVPGLHFLPEDSTPRSPPRSTPGWRHCPDPAEPRRRPSPSLAPRCPACSAFARQDADRDADRPL